MAETAIPLITDTDAFLAWESEQAERYEFIAGGIRMMTGGTLNHDRIAINLAAELHQALRGTPCFAHGSNLMVTSPSGAVMYPDAFVICGNRAGNDTSVDDPVLIVEVLSPSTEKHDLTIKRWAYQAIASVQTILLINADVPQVEHAVREADGSWRSIIHTSIDNTLTITVHESIPAIELPLSAIYEGVEFVDGADTPVITPR